MSRIIKRMDLGIHVQMGRLHFYEIKLFFQHEDGERFNTVTIPASKLKSLGVIKRTNSYKKIRDWLLTIQAQDVIQEGLYLKYGRESCPYYFEGVTV